MRLVTPLRSGRSTTPKINSGPDSLNSELSRSTLVTRRPAKTRKLQALGEALRQGRVHNLREALQFEEGEAGVFLDLVWWRRDDDIMKMLNQLMPKLGGSGTGNAQRGGNRSPPSNQSRPGSCFICGQKYHWAAKCPKRGDVLDEGDQAKGPRRFGAAQQRAMATDSETPPDPHKDGAGPSDTENIMAICAIPAKVSMGFIFPEASESNTSDSSVSLTESQQAQADKDCYEAAMAAHSFLMKQTPGGI